MSIPFRLWSRHMRYTRLDLQCKFPRFRLQAKKANRWLVQDVFYMEPATPYLSSLCPLIEEAQSKVPPRNVKTLVPLNRAMPNSAAGGTVGLPATPYNMPGELIRRWEFREYTWQSAVGLYLFSQCKVLASSGLFGVHVACYCRACSLNYLTIR